MALAPFHDFTLVVGCEHYLINKFAACVLSPKIGDLLKGDPTFSRFSLTTPDPSTLFPHVLSLLSDATVSLDVPVGSFLAAVVVELGNRDLITAMCLIRDDAELLDVANVVPRLLRRVSLGIAIPDSELDFTASHFMEFEGDILSHLGGATFAGVSRASESCCRVGGRTAGSETEVGHPQPPRVRAVPIPF
jgi:hypothetical protein